MKYLTEYLAYSKQNDISDILLDRNFLYQLSYNILFTENEGKYIRNIIRLNKSQLINENELDILFYYDNISEGFLSNIRDKSKELMNKLGSSVSNIFNEVNIFIKKYVNEIINSFDKTFNVFGKKNDTANQNISKNLYNKYSENIGTMVTKFDKEEIKWYDTAYNFLLNTYNEILSLLKKLFTKETNDMIKESILNGNFLLEDDTPKQFDDHLNDKLSNIKKISIKIDQYINTKFLWLFKILNTLTNFSLIGFSKSLELSGGPSAPKNGFKTTGSTFIYVIHNKYFELSTYVSKYTNTKTIVSSFLKKAFKKTISIMLPGTGIMFKLIGLINNIDVTRRLLLIIEHNK